MALGPPESAGVARGPHFPVLRFTYRSVGRRGCYYLLFLPAPSFQTSSVSTEAAAGETRARLREDRSDHDQRPTPPSVSLNSAGKRLPGPPAAGLWRAGGRECGARRSVLSSGLPSWLSRRPGQGCSQVAAFPIRALRDESSPFPAAWPPFQPPPPEASMARVPAGAAPPLRLGPPQSPGRPAEAPPGCWSDLACSLRTGSRPAQE